MKGTGNLFIITSVVPSSRLLHRRDPEGTGDVIEIPGKGHVKKRFGGAEIIPHCAGRNPLSLPPPVPGYSDSGIFLRYIPA